jgi:uncharacterized delta-60 repeat protein
MTPERDRPLPAGDNRCSAVAYDSGTMKRFAIVASLALLALGPLGVGSAADLPLAGDLDSSFGNGGIVSLVHNGSVGAIVLQPDGKVVVASDSYPSPGGLLARYLPNGSLDPSFGGGGSVATQVESGPYSLGGVGLALQSDGKIVVAGSSPGQGDETGYSVFTLARYNPDGSLDTSFGADGVTSTTIPVPAGFGDGPTDSGARSLAILPGGEILAAGTVSWFNGYMPADFVLVKYTANGSLDPTFGEGGIVQTRFYGDDYLYGIVAQTDGKVVATGFGAGFHGDETRTIALARYESDGSLDPSFGHGGKATTPPRLRYQGGVPALQGRKIFLAGYTERNDFLVLARYRASGRLDSTFGKRGFVEIKRVTGLPTAVLTQPDGKILIAGYNGGGGTVLRLLPNGRLDPSFGKRGMVSLDPGAPSLALQQDGKILVGGQTLDRLVGGNNCVVPGLRGRTVPKADAELKAAYCLRGSIAKRFSTTVRRGRVVSTRPVRAARLPDGTKVHLIVSKGKRH